MVGLGGSFLQPASARGQSKADTSLQTAFVKNLAIKSSKPCQRTVPGAVGTSCSTGVMVGLEATSSVVLESPTSAVEPAPFADMTLSMQWLGAPQFRPPRTFA